MRGKIEGVFYFYRLPNIDTFVDSVVTQCILCNNVSEKLKGVAKLCHQNMISRAIQLLSLPLIWKCVKEMTSKYVYLSVNHIKGTQDAIKESETAYWYKMLEIIENLT